MLTPQQIRNWTRLVQWTPHRGQQTAIDALRRYSLIVCGRRWGKTALASKIASAGAFKGGLVWVVGESFGVSDITLDACYADLRRASEALPGLISRYSRGEHRIELRTGGIIEAKSGEHPEGMLGRGLAGVVYEEAAAGSARIWQQFIRPALSDFRGWAAFITSPRGRANWTYELAQDNAQDAEFVCLNSPSWDNNHVFPGGRNDPEIVAWRAQYERAGLLPLWEQECAGSFSHLQGRVYQALDPSKHFAPQSKVKDSVTECRLGIDWGHHHPCAILVIGRTGDGGYRVLDEWYQSGKTPTEIEDEAVKLAAKWGAKGGWADPSQPGSILGMCDRRLDVRAAFNDVTEGILSVASAMGRKDGLVVAQDACPNLCRELEDYCWRPTSNRQTEEPVKVNDDAVDSLRYGIASWDRMLGEGTVTPGRISYGPTQRGRLISSQRRY